MSIPTRVTMLFLVSCSLWFVGAAHAGILITEHQDEAIESHLFDNGVYYQFTDGRLESSFNVKANVCVNVNHDSRVYFSGACDAMYRDTLELMSNSYNSYQNDSSRSEMQRQMDDAAIKAMANMNKVVITQASLGKEKHLGYVAERFELRYEGKPIKEVWVSSSLRDLVQKEFDLTRFQEQQASYTEKFKKTLPFEADDPISRAIVQFEKKGIVLKELTVSGADSVFPMAVTGLLSLTNNREVVTINTHFTPAKASNLHAPASYKKSTSWQEFMQLQLHMDDDE